MAQAIVIPHSLQTITAGSLVIAFLISLYRLQKDRNMFAIAIDFWIPINIVVNIFYIVVGLNNHAYYGFIPIVIISSIIAPILWIWVSRAIYFYFCEKEIIGGFFWLGILGAMSVALFFFIFLNFGAYAVGFWIDKDNANVLVSGGQVAATMAIYGSFIFVAAAFSSSPEIIRNVMLRISIILVVFVVALTSGRAALMVSIVIGGFTGILVKMLNQNPKLKSLNIYTLIGYSVIAIVATLLLIVIDVYSADVDLGITLSNLSEKLFEGGGDLRVWQYDALLQGIKDTDGLGAGHGVGVTLIRSTEYPWRYELTPLATILRVGIIGFLLLMIPYVYYIFEFIKRMATTGVDTFDTFMFSGFVAFLAASFTNPYPESFIFQFSLYIPIVLFEMKYRRRPRKKRTTAAKQRKQFV